MVFMVFTNGPLGITWRTHSLVFHEPNVPNDLTQSCVGDKEDKVVVCILR